MTTSTSSAQRITINGQTVADAQATSVPHEASLVLRLADGSERELPASVQRMLLGALTSIAQQGSVTIGRLPESLTSTVAADLLGVSRPTLMKWVKEDVISSSKKGSHARFNRDDVLELRDRNAASRRAALDELRALDEEHEDFFTD